MSGTMTLPPPMPTTAPMAPPAVPMAARRGASFLTSKAAARVPLHDLEAAAGHRRLMVGEHGVHRSRARGIMPAAVARRSAAAMAAAVDGRARREKRGPCD
mmetsp:Transcript_47015/g.134186  ORF Transcript_47015/g.134186 Transcript_47015/m.134186 type:complete len:101 (-) Transcript_47015:20-322(-)